MKILIALLFLLHYGTSESNELEQKMITHGTLSSFSINIVRSDNLDNVLLAGQDNWNRRAILQSVAPNGRTNWEFSIDQDEQSVVPYTAVTDVFQANDDTYVLCMNHTASKSDPRTFFSFYVLDKSGALLSTREISLNATSAHDLLKVQKCWRDRANIYLAGSTRKLTVSGSIENSESLYWVKTLDNAYRVIKTDFFLSTLSYAARITDIAILGHTTFLLGSNGRESEILSTNAITSTENKSIYSSQTRMIASKENIFIISREKNILVVAELDQSLNTLKSNRFSMSEHENTFSFFSAGDGGFKILTTILNGNSSELRLTKLNADLSHAQSTVLGSWKPVAQFAYDSASLKNGVRALQFSQYFDKGPVKFKNTLVFISEK